MFDLSGKTALVTGASGGIGGGIARVLAGNGARVALSGTRVDALEALARELDGRGVMVAADLSVAGAAKDLFREAEARLGSVDILVNNAGITRDGLILRMSDDDWQKVIDVNLTAGFQLARAALRGMMKKRWGRIIGITSVVAASGNAGQVNYAAAKAGMIGMTKALAREVASRGITVNCVAPGFIETDMTSALAAEQRQKVIEDIPVGRLGTIEDVGSSVLFLASTEAAYITGQTIHVNGGMVMV